MERRHGEDGLEGGQRWEKPCQRQNKAHTKKGVDADHGLSGGRREETGRIKEQRNLMRNFPGA